MATPEPIPEHITEELYKRNAELAVKNKTLSLLSRLYEISILTLEPSALAGRITQSIQDALDFDLVGILRYDDVADELVPFQFEKSKRLSEALGRANESFDSLRITHASKHDLFGSVLSGSGMSSTQDMAAIWDDLVPKDIFVAAGERGHLRTALVYPLTLEYGNILGLLMIGLNRAYEDLGEFEQESIRSFVNIIAIALGKAFLYQELQVTNEKLSDANEKLKEFDEQKSEFVSLVGHQLRAPMTVIKGYVSLIMDGTIKSGTKKEKEVLDKVMFSTEELVKLVSGLLDLSRIESGKIKYEFVPGDFTKMVHEVIDKFRQSAERKKITIRFQDGEGAPAHVGTPQMLTYDADKMREVVINLIDNAIKYSGENSEVRVHEERVPGSNGEDRVRLTVVDSGLGIKPGDIEKLFVKFSRTDEAKAHDPGGMGIGLYFLKRVVEDHGGTVGVSSGGIGKGSTFWIELPAGNSIQNVGGGRGT